MLLLTQYGQLYGLFDSAEKVVEWAEVHIPKHLWSEYRVHAMGRNMIFIPGADNQFNLKDLIS